MEVCSVCGEKPATRHDACGKEVCEECHELSEFDLGNDEEDSGDECVLAILLGIF